MLLLLISQVKGLSLENTLGGEEACLRLTCRKTMLTQSHLAALKCSLAENMDHKVCLYSVLLCLIALYVLPLQNPGHYPYLALSWGLSKVVIDCTAHAHHKDIAGTE